MSALATPDQHIAPAAKPGATLRNFMSAQWRKLMRRACGSYRPERHYMRGCGPKCQAKQSPADNP